MVRKSNYDYINGSTVFAPERSTSNPLRKEEYDKLRKAQIERINRIIEKKNSRKRKVMGSIITVFIAGIGLIWGEAQVYSTQQQLNKMRKEIVEISRQNDDLKVQLVKVSSLEHIKLNAEDKMHMINPDREDVIYADLSKDNFSKGPKDDRENKAKDVFTKIKNLLF